jgi:hypothetical protein
MAYVLGDGRRQPVWVLGRLNWSLRRSAFGAAVRRETASSHLKAAGIAVRAAIGLDRCPGFPNIPDRQP